MSTVQFYNAQSANTRRHLALASYVCLEKVIDEIEKQKIGKRMYLFPIWNLMCTPRSTQNLLKSITDAEVRHGHHAYISRACIIAALNKIVTLGYSQSISLNCIIRRLPQEGSRHQDRH